MIVTFSLDIQFELIGSQTFFTNDIHPPVSLALIASKSKFYFLISTKALTKAFNLLQDLITISKIHLTNKFYSC